MIELKKESLKFNGMYRGKVLDNEDSGQLGRVKLEVQGVFDGISSSDLPWAIPAMPLFAGAGDGFGCFTVPAVNSCVWCFFEAGDFNQPVYFAEATDGVHGLPTERITDYPKKKVWKTKNDIVISINDADGSQEIKVVHPGGATITIDNAGNVSVDTSGDISMTASGDISADAGGDISATAAGDVDVTAAGAVTVKGAFVKINP